jgi:hypothetical protein
LKPRKDGEALFSAYAFACFDLPPKRWQTQIHFVHFELIVGGGQGHELLVSLQCLHVIAEFIEADAEEV